MRIFILFFFLSFSVHAQTTYSKLNDYHKADSIALSYKGSKLTELYTLTQNLTKDLSSDKDKYRSIFYWICTNIEGDRFSNSKNQQMRMKYSKDEEKLIEWNNSFAKKVFKILVDENKTVCTGYAYLLRSMCQMVNIECVIVDGFGRSIQSVFFTKDNLPNHSWSAVKLDGQWYLSDPTWASGYFKNKEYTFTFKFNEGYFLSSPEQFILTHFPMDQQWQLLDKYLTFDDFTQRALHYHFAFSNQIFVESPSIFSNQVMKNEEFNITLKVSDNINSEKLTLRYGKELNLLKAEIIASSKNNIIIKSKLPFKGYYDVHVFYGEEIVATLNYKSSKKQKRD
ncbi:transglutaminase domain-containing protein [Flammeovirga pacifica]|uniref:Transglutaminase-like domain-containing protein n=1 Tax=Flammeovirga pacifica TaxID=915059 RepID=A0A1S1YZN5_FLAPC|nr:transglutaminase domain-containing protein [Flammeovirga pacifica]OHX66460.1 hypothetical protein NH26_08875 [Flammeovirga pacifica]